eukprot:7293984-Prymnesium_polylepis.1
MHSRSEACPFAEQLSASPSAAVVLSASASGAAERLPDWASVPSSNPLDDGITECSSARPPTTAPAERGD